MKYDFTSVIDRTGKDSSAWENIPVPNAEIAEGFDRIPMWVADMNFQTAPSVCEAITKRLEHQVFGYFNPSEEYYNSIINWQKVRCCCRAAGIFCTGRGNPGSFSDVYRIYQRPEQ